MERRCEDCAHFFIFFAEEQKFWYEVLKFGLDSDCVRCVPCRKRVQRIKNDLRRYETLHAIDDRTPEQNFEMADLTLSLIENGTFTVKQCQHARMLLNRLPDGYRDPDVSEMRRRLLDVLESLPNDRTKRSG